MFMGAMVMGPLAGLVIKKFDAAVDGRIKPGFEMLVNNFSVGIIGMLLSIVGFYLIGPVMGILLTFLTAAFRFSSPTASSPSSASSSNRQRYCS